MSNLPRKSRPPVWSRRQAINLTALAAAGTSLSRGAEEGPQPKLKVLVAGGHPDDPETGCGGAICKYTAAGHTVSVVYLTRGEAGIRGVSHEEAARIRTEEARQACAAMKAKPIFAGQMDGATEITPKRYADMLEILHSENPDVVFTQWPLDTHRDHRICGNLVFDAWLASGRRAALYYYEVATGFQTQTFSPTHRVNLDAVIEQKWKACFLHKSQGITKERYDRDHGRMELFRGLEARCRYAEAFVRHTPGPEIMLP